MNIKESVIFLNFAREALTSVIECAKSEHTEDLVNFVMNEASDYQVMHLLTYNCLPTSEGTIIDEENVFEDFRTAIMLNEDVVDETVYEGFSLEMISELGPVTPYLSGIGSHIMMESVLSGDITEEMMFENAISYFESHEEELNEITAAQAKEIGASRRKITPEIAALIGAKKRKQTLVQQLQTAVGPAKDAIQKKIDAVGPQIDKLKGQASAAASAVATKGREVAGKAKDVVLGKKGEYEMKGVRSGGLISKGKELAGRAVGAVTGAAKSAGEFVAKHKEVAGGLGAAAVAAAAAYGAYKIYKNYFSKAAKACANKSGDAKKSCMMAYKQKGLKAQIATLAKGKAKCNKSKDAAKCKAAIDKKISALQGKLAG